MHFDPLLPRLVATLWVLVALALAGRRLGQPMPVVYIVAGIALGPFGLGVLEDTKELAHVGEYGVILLLFLLGAEIRLAPLLASWRTPVFGLLLQVGASLASVAAVGAWLGWPLGRTVLLGFAISLSSTAVVLRLLEQRKLGGTALGADTLAILLAQDLALAPMVVVLGMLGDGHVSARSLAVQGVGALLLLGAVGWVARRGRLTVPFARALRADTELQVFAGLLFALTLALFASAVGLSAAFGAFVAGVLVGATPETDWVHHSLHPIRVVLVAVFLAAVGMLLDLGFLWANLPLVSFLAGLALLTNTLINAGILKVLGRPWREAMLGGALLSQIGEFSFVLAALGLESALITSEGYQLALAVISVTLLLSAIWISVVSASLGTLPPLQPVPEDPGSSPGSHR